MPQQDSILPITKTIDKEGKTNLTSEDEDKNDMDLKLKMDWRTVP